MSDAPVLERQQLATLGILEGVDLDGAAEVLNACPTRTLAAGEVLLKNGQANNTMYMILSGELSVHLDSEHSEPVAFLPAGQTVGELSVIDDSPAGAYVVACEDSRLLKVGEDTFWSLVAASHSFAKNLLLLLAKRMRANNYKITENVKLRQRYERDAMVDALTGVFNRRWLDETLPRFVRRYARGEQPLSLLILDVDHFKRFNDTYGHSAGDEVLRVVAASLGDKLRPDDFRARYGGEEFVVLLPNSDTAGAQAAAERLRIAVRETQVYEDGKELPRVTISLGVATLQPTEDGPALIARADAALYRAKKNGRDRFELG